MSLPCFPLFFVLCSLFFFFFFFFRYAEKRANFFHPTPLGLALCQAYMIMDNHLEKPQLRAKVIDNNNNKKSIYIFYPFMSIH